MKKTILLIVISSLSLGVFAQTKTEVKTDVQLENTDGKYHIKIKKEVDGKITTIDKIYNSLEEMKNDPELEGINLHIFDADNNKQMVFIKEDGEEGEHDVNVIVELDGDSDLHKSDGSNHSFVFKSDGEDGETIVHDIKVSIDEDGVKHIIKDGEEIEVGEGNSWTDKEGKVYDIKKSDGNIMILSGDDLHESKSTDGKTIEYKFSTDDAEGGEHKVIVFKSADGDDVKHETITVKVVEHINIHLKEVDTDEFNNIEGIDAKALKMDELNYYPNPNSGKFTLQFKADERPTEVRITGLDGKEVYSENLSGFNGTYQKEIDLSLQKRGVYLLQIIQGKKATNKKIVIE